MTKKHYILVGILFGFLSLGSHVFAARVLRVDAPAGSLIWLGLIASAIGFGLTQINVPFIQKIGGFLLGTGLLTVVVNLF